MEEKLKNKKLKLEEKQIFEIIIDLALDDKERKKYNKSFAEKKAIVLSILDSLKTNEIHLENIKGWEGYIQRTVTTRDYFDVKTFKKENPASGVTKLETAFLSKKGYTLVLGKNPVPSKVTVLDLHQGIIAVAITLEPCDSSSI